MRVCVCINIDRQCCFAIDKQFKAAEGFSHTHTNTQLEFQGTALQLHQKIIIYKGLSLCNMCVCVDSLDQVKPKHSVIYSDDVIYLHFFISALIGPPPVSTDWQETFK